jgi:hypothetical protein
MSYVVTDSSSMRVYDGPNHPATGDT